MQWLADHKILHLLAGVVIDKDSTTGKFLKAEPSTKHVKLYYDPGHIKQSMQSQLITAFGQADAMNRSANG
jgi:hypothetical protein